MLHIKNPLILLLLRSLSCLLRLCAFCYCCPWPLLLASANSESYKTLINAVEFRLDDLFCQKLLGPRRSATLTFPSLLPSAMKLWRLCFYTCVSVHRGGLPQCMLGYHPPGPGTPPGTRYPPKDQAPPRDQTPPPPGTRHPPQTRHTPRSRRLLLRTARILLECILVKNGASSIE